MAIENLAPALVGVLTSVAGLALRASRRNRLRTRVDEHLAVAERLDTVDAVAARRFRALAGETATQLALLEERSLRRKLDPAAVFAVLFLTVPSASVFFVALDWDTGWRLPTLIITGTWTLVWGAFGITQLFTDRTDEAEAERSSGEARQ